MTWFSALPTPETQVGIAIETTRGTPKAPDFWVPVTGPKYKPDVQFLPDAGLRGSMVTLYDEVPGLRYDSYAWDHHPYLDTLPVELRALLGSTDTLTAAPIIAELAKEAKVADTTIEVSAVGPEGSKVVIEPGSVEQEIFTITKVVGKVLTLSGKIAKVHANKAAITVATELVKEALVGDTKITTIASIPAGSYVVIGAGVGTMETHVTGTPVEVKAGEWTIPLTYPVAFAHANKAIVEGLVKHQFSLLNNSPATGNQPPSCTITDFAGEENWRQLAAAQLNTLNISGAADSLPKVTVDWFANGAIKPSPPSASYSTAEAPAGWTVQASIGGTQIAYLVSWEFDSKRNVKNVPAITGNQNYYQHFAGALEATAKVVVLDDPKATWLTAFQEGASESIDLTLSDVASGFAVNLHSSSAKFITGDLDRSKEYVEVPLELQLIPSPTDALAGGVSPIVATVANAHTLTY